MPGDGWTGPRDGPFRGEHLVACREHGGWWTPSRPCPACRERTKRLTEVAAAQAEGDARVAALIARLAAEHDQRCTACAHRKGSVS